MRDHAISAIGDSCWSKRFYNFNFDTYLSEGVLIGGVSKKIIFFRIRINIVIFVKLNNKIIIMNAIKIEILYQQAWNPRLL